MATSILNSSLTLSSTPTPKTPKSKRPQPPITISTNPSHLNPHHLQHLLFSSNYSCHRFPILSSNGRPEPVDARKLEIAVANSFVVVSVFLNEKFLKENGDPVEDPSGILGFEDFFQMLATEPDSEGRLVGFGRAVSDGGLTASIHDVVVMPSLRRLGIGRKIVQRIIRVLTGRGIYDISALCSEKERLFFEACGFGEDSLGSTTMIYTRTASSSSQNNQMLRPAGRMLLLIPPVKEPFLSKIVAAEADDTVIISMEIS